jgi:UPI00016E19E8 related cluster
MKKFINKKNVVIAVIVAILIAVSVYMLANKKSDVKTNTEKTSEVTTKEDKSDKKNTVKSDTKKEDKKDNKQEVKEDKKSDTKVEETKTTEVTDTNTSTNVSNNTSTNKNTVSNNGCKTVYHDAVTHNVYHEAVTQQVWVVDTPAHDETTYTLVYYMQFSNGEKWYHDGSSNFAEKVVDYAAVNGLSYSTGAENQPNTVHYDEVGHYETQVVSQAWTETVVDTPAYTTCE